MDAFSEAFERTVGIEGAYINDSRDSGGETKYGITAAVARANGYAGSLVNLTLGVAEAIYRRQYWNLLHLDDIAPSSKAIALELFDTGVICGVATAARYLQRALNAFNRGGRDYPDLTVDGVVGPVTIHALRCLLAIRGDEGAIVLLRALNALQGAGYIELVEKRAKDEAFVFGWYRARVA